MSELVELENTDLIVTVNSFGAEVISVRNKSDGHEYIWSGESAIWGRHSPLLFPYVGKLNKDTLIVDGFEYEQNKQHGFARDSNFNIVNAANSEKLETSLTSAEFELTQNEETLKIYPFSFTLKVSYTLVGRTLKTIVEVINSDDYKLPFSFGFHPAFSTSLPNSKGLTDFELQFETCSKFTINRLDNGFNGGRVDTKYSIDSDGKLPLTREIFEDDVVILKDMSIQSVLMKYRGNEYVRLNYSSMPYLGVWTKTDPKAEFVCIEPWHGIADSLSEVATPFTIKEGLIILESKENWSCFTEVEFYEVK